MVLPTRFFKQVAKVAAAACCTPQSVHGGLRVSKAESAAAALEKYTHGPRKAGTYVLAALTLHSSFKATACWYLRGFKNTVEG